MTPGERTKAALAKHGTAAVATWCASVLTGGPWDGPRLDWIADASAHREEWLANPVNQYWPRVWAARSFLYGWHPDATSAVIAGLSDEAWRVREMCAKVIRLRDLGEAGDVLSTLVTDPTPRVRVAAIKALAVVGEAEHAEAVKTARDDPEPTVRDAAGMALRRMAERLDRPL